MKCLLNKKRVKTIFFFLAKYILALLFAYSFMKKVLNLNMFKVKLMRSELIPDTWVWFLGYLVPLIELVVVILLVTSFKTKISLYFSLSTLFIFTFYLFSINHFSLYTGCSCGGIFERLTYSQHLLVNIFFMGINIFALFCKRENY